MLSVIVCSNNYSKLNALTESVKKTIGDIKYEIVGYDNSEYNFGIAGVYNSCCLSSTYEYLCFVHDDILFHTAEWGAKIIQYLQDQNTAFIGVMGGRYKSANGLLWRDGATDMYRFNIKDGVEQGKHLYFNPNNEEKSEVVCLDGAFLCCRKAIFEKIAFDGQTLNGFHFYDADICLQASANYKNYVVYDILIEHFSRGKLDISFVLDSFSFEKKWNERLPVFLDNLTPNTIKKMEGFALAEKLVLMKRLKFPFLKRSQLIVQYFIKHKNIYHLLRSTYFGFLKKST